MSEPFVQPHLTWEHKQAQLRYRRLFNGSKRSNFAVRQTAKEELAAARTVLAPAEIAVLDLVAGRDSSVNGLARETRRTPDQLWRIYKDACDALVVYFGLKKETIPPGDEGGGANDKRSAA
jgi:hypothetical protein